VLALLTVLLSFQLSAGSPPDATTVPSSVHESLTERLAKSELELLELSHIARGKQQVAIFTYRHTSQDWPYGTGLVVYPAADAPIEWLFFHPGDFGIHSVRWVDLDGDRRDDLYSLAGQEDVFTTYAFVRPDRDDTGGQESFVKAYEFSDAYVSLFDFDSDGVPELLQPVDPKDVNEEECDCLNELTKAQIDEISSAYRRFAGPYDRLNFDYNLESYPVINLCLFEQVRILRVEGQTVKEVGREYPQHWSWRRAMLAGLKFPEDSCCPQQVAELLDSLDGR